MRMAKRGAWIINILPIYFLPRQLPHVLLSVFGLLFHRHTALHSVVSKQMMLWTLMTSDHFPTGALADYIHVMTQILKDEMYI